MHSNNQRHTRLGSPVSLPVFTAVAFGVLAIITSVWAVVLHNEAESLREEMATIRANANATLYLMEPTENAPVNMRGQIFIGTSGSGVVVVSNLPPAGDNEVFQLWLLDTDEDSALAAGILMTDAAGQGFALIPADSSGYARIAISLESEDENDTPGGSFLLVGEVNPLRGERLSPVNQLLLCQNHIG